MNNEDFNGYLKDTLGAYKETPDAEALWSKVEKRLDEKKRRPLWIWWLPATLFLTIGTGFWHLQTGKMYPDQHSNLMALSPARENDHNRPAKELILPPSEQIHEGASLFTGKSSTAASKQPGHGWGANEPAPKTNRNKDAGQVFGHSPDLLATLYLEQTASTVQALLSGTEKNLPKSKENSKRVVLSKTGNEIPKARNQPEEEISTGFVLPVDNDVAQIQHSVRSETTRQLAENNPLPAGKETGNGRSGPLPPVDGNEVYVKTTPQETRTNTSPLTETSETDSMETDTSVVPSIDMSTSFPVLRVDSSGLVIHSSRFYFLTGPSVFWQEARMVTSRKEVQLPTRLPTSYGWFATMGYQESVTRWLRVGAQAGFSLVNQTLEYTKTASQAPVLQVDPATGTLIVQSTSRSKETTSRWLLNPSLGLLLDVHTLSSKGGIRLGGGILGWYGTNTGSGSAFTLRPQLTTQMYTRLRNWELNLSLQSFSVARDAIPVFENAKGQNWMLGIGIGKRW